MTIGRKEIDRILTNAIRTNEPSWNEGFSLVNCRLFPSLFRKQLSDTLITDDETDFDKSIVNVMLMNFTSLSLSQ